MVIPQPRKLELQVMEVLWTCGPLSIRDVQERLSGETTTYETVRSVIYRLQSKKVIRRVRKVSNTQIFEASASRSAVRENLIDDFADMFAGEMQAVFARLARTGRLTMSDLETAGQLFAPLK